MPLGRSEIPEPGRRVMALVARLILESEGIGVVFGVVAGPVDISTQENGVEERREEEVRMSLGNARKKIAEPQPQRELQKKERKRGEKNKGEKIQTTSMSKE